MLGYSLLLSDGRVIGSDEGIILGFTDGELLDTILINIDEITLGIDVGTDLVSLDGYLYGSNYGTIQVMLLQG